MERGKDPADFGVRLIGTNGFRLSPFWRELFEAKFKAQVFDNYSLSEFATPATECKACGWLHFGRPPIVHEVLDLVSEQRVERGAGRLLLTGLYPYVHKMPLIRYDTGDVVELGSWCKATGKRCLRFLGRAQRGLVIRDGERGVFALAPVYVQDVLENCAETERAMHAFHTLGLVRTRDIGLPRWTVELSESPGPTARLLFEVRFDPLFYTAHARELEKKIRANVLELDQRLRGLCDRRVLEFQVAAVQSGSLTVPPDKYD